jgi:hypothetical protein
MGIPIGGLISIGVTVCVLYILFVICYSVYLYFTPNKLRPKSAFYWPSFINNWLGNPQTFSMAAGSIAVGNDILNTLTNVHAVDCMSNCNVTENCVGFTMYDTSNTCNTFTVISSTIPDLTSRANVYVTDGNVPTSQYILNLGKTYSQTSNIQSYISSSPANCGSNCSSNAVCTGFTYNILNGTCIQQSNVYFTTSNLTAATGFNSYTRGSINYTEVGNPYAESGLF